MGRSFEKQYPLCQSWPSCSSGGTEPTNKAGSILIRYGRYRYFGGSIWSRLFGKSLYVALKALVWAQQSGKNYDHILAYWGNYAATSAYIFRRLINKNIPFSIFLHAGIDLYENPVYLRQKLLAADKIITCSEFNRQFIQQHFSQIYSLIENKIYVHYHGVDLSEFRFQPDGRPAGKNFSIGGLL